MRDWLSHRVVSSPDDVALVRAEDGETWTYADLDRLVDRMAGRLSAHGIGEGDHLGVLMPPYVGTVGLIHATMRVGATFVPLGERLTPPELADRIELTDLTALVCAESTEDDALAAVEDVPLLTVGEPNHPSVEELHGVDAEPVEPTRWDLSERLCLLFTSGTTGNPKPVELTAGNVTSSAVASAFRLGIDPEDRWLVSLSLHHMGGLAPIYRSTLYGTTVVLREGFDPGATADDIDRYDVTGVSLVPTMLQRALDSRGTLADSLRVVLLGGAPAPEVLIERCHDYSIPVYPTYGMTEAASQIATATPDQANERLGTVGRPLFGTGVTVVDDDGSPLERGETGEIVVAGPTITPGYYGDPDATNEAFGPYGLHTGDLGRIDEEGYLYVLDRVDDRIISGGENVIPAEVADALREHPSVADTAVVGLEDEMWGERVAALIEVEASVSRFVGESAREGDETNIVDGGPYDEEELFEFVRGRLAGFKIPRTIAYTEELPRTVSGTVDREAVRKTLLNRGFSPGGTGTEFDEAGFEPADPEPVDGATPSDEAAVEPRNTDDGDDDYADGSDVTNDDADGSDVADSDVESGDSDDGTPEGRDSNDSDTDGRDAKIDPDEPESAE